jgi:hypothetical protein
VLPLNTAESAVYPALASADSVSRSYKDALSAGLKPSISRAVSVGFTTVTYKKKPAPASIPVYTVKHRHQPLIGIRNSANLSIVSKRKGLRPFSFPAVAQRSWPLILKIHYRSK